MADGVDPARLSLRPITPADMPFLSAVYASTREEELSVVPWTPAQKQAFLQAEFEAQHRHYQENYVGASFDLIMLGGEAIGRLYVARWPSELRIMDIALLPSWRNRGIGSQLLAGLLAEADAAGKDVSLHVEYNNPSRRLYARLGFEFVETNGVYQLLRRRAGAQKAR